MDKPGLIFVDESNIVEGTFGALAAVFVSADKVEQISNAVASVTSELRELKWNKTNDGRHKRAALNTVSLLVPHIQRCEMRIDTLSWSKSDSRHRGVYGRDDYANMENLLVHLLVNGMSKWRNASAWNLHPDELQNVDFVKVQRAANSRIQMKAGGEWSSRMDVTPEITYVDPMSSESHPLIQVADLFAGIAQYVRTEAVVKQPGTKSEIARHEILSILLPEMSKFGLLRWFPNEGIVTNRNSGINFWAYRPQGDYDRAPTTNQRTFVPELRECRDCSNNFWADENYKTYCAQCYFNRRREADRKNDIAEAQRVRRDGRWYCDICVRRFNDDEVATMLTGRTYDAVAACPVHRKHALTELFSAHVEDWTEERPQRDPEIKRPNVKLQRQSYRDDD